jgi:hypothetical protein
LLPITVLPFSAAMPIAARYCCAIWPHSDAAPASARPMPSSTERLPRWATSFGMSRDCVETTKTATSSVTAIVAWVRSGALVAMSGFQ